MLANAEPEAVILGSQFLASLSYLPSLLLSIQCNTGFIQEVFESDDRLISFLELLLAEPLVRGPSELNSRKKNQFLDQNQ